jgi:hypothetical protein
VGLRSKEYCILNRRYSKEDYQALLLRIVAHMRRTGEWGEFFPMRISPHAYNTSVCDDYFPVSREEAGRLGAKWYEPAAAEGGPPECVVPDSAAEIDDAMTGQTFLCAQSGKPFKFIAAELGFYRAQGLPLPNLCFRERHRQRLDRRAPRRVWQRECACCGARTHAVFAPERPEIVYCVECFIRELR